MDSNKIISRWISIGLLTLTLGGGALLIWMNFAPLSSAAIAPGQVVVEGYKKKIQHLEGGIIEQIHVKEGQQISAGDLLITLNSTKTKTRLLQIKSRYFNALAKYNRLQSEINERTSIDFSPQLVVDEPLAKQAIATQNKLKQIRAEALSGLVDVAEKRVEQARQSLNSYIAKAKVDRQAVALLNEQVLMLSKLVKKGFASKDQILNSQRDRLDIQRRLDDYDAVIYRSELVIAEAQQSISNLRLEFVKEAAEELESAERDIIELKEHLSQAQEDWQRTEIRSPIDGKIVSLDVHTRGGIIGSGDVLMEVVPIDDKLIVEAQVSPSDIDMLQIGQKAEVRLTSYNYRRVLPIVGEVIYISADSIEDERNNESTYTINVRLDMETVAQNSHIKLHPGMPADVLILLDERTVVDYLLNPILMSMNKAFRDSDY